MSGDEGVFQHFPLNARPMRQAVLERMNEALEAHEPVPDYLMAALPGWECKSISATLEGLNLALEEREFEGFQETLSWCAPWEDERGNIRHFDWEEWPVRLRDVVTHDEAECFHRYLGRRWREIEDAFLDAALAGKEAIYARIGSPVERSVTRIPPDVWANFSVVDWKTGRAQVPYTDHVIYGACAVAVALPGAGTGSMAHDQALALLIRENESRVSGGMPPLTIQETERWAATEGLTREMARALRDRLPNHLKLAVGQKKRDLKVRPE